MSARWPWYVALSVFLGAYMGLNSYINVRSVASIAPWMPFFWEMSSILVLAALVPLVIRFEARFRSDARPRMPVIAAHGLAVLVFSLLHVVLMVLVRKLVYGMLGRHYDFGNVPLQGLFELQRDVLVYCGILGVIFAVREFRVRRDRELRAAGLAAELSTARLRHLTSQIEPHFLFNSLNAISNRMHEDVEAADRMISQLGDLLRAAYESDHHLLVPLARELEWLRSYAAMMGERFRGQLVFDIEIEPGLETVQVPRLLLQPIVENALKHGISEGHGRVSVDVRRRGPRLSYTVSDDGSGFIDTAAARGTGLSNIARRLELLFPGEHLLEFGTRRPHGALVTISFPVT